MQLTREQICELTGRKLAASTERLSSLRATLGLDGLVEEVVAVIDRRTDAQVFLPAADMQRLVEKLREPESVESSQYELVVRHRRAGGQGPAMAMALAAMGVSVTYIGNLGVPQVDPIFSDLAAKTRVISIADPGRNEAIEMEAGRAAFGRCASLGDVSWDSLVSRIGRDELKNLLDGSHLIGMVNWSMRPNMTRIWAKLLDEITPGSERHHRKLFIDLADPSRHSQENILEGLQLLQRFQDQVDVILGLNLRESLDLADVLGLPGTADPEAAIEENARAIREKLKLACVVIHPRRSAAAATERESARFEGPFVRQPRTSHGAGDHFSAGFCLGRVLGFSVEESLCSGVGTSGFFVRTGQSPNLAQLSDFVLKMPPPQP